MRQRYILYNSTRERKRERWGESGGETEREGERERGRETESERQRDTDRQRDKGRGGGYGFSFSAIWGVFSFPKPNKIFLRCEHICIICGENKHFTAPCIC